MISGPAPLPSGGPLPAAAHAVPFAGASAAVAHCGVAVLDNGIDRIDWIDMAGRLIDTNVVGRRALDLSGVRRCIGTDWVALWRPDQQAMVADHLKRSRTGAASRFTAASGPADHAVWWDVVVSRVSDTAVLAQARDITQARATEERFRQRTRHDELTGLLNRSAFKEVLGAAIAARMADGGSGMVLMLDLDNFKFINDTMGHDAGDRVLQSAARMLDAVVGPDEHLARLGGDEFAILLPHVAGSSTLRIRADTINARLRQPVDLDGRRIVTGASIGAAQFPRYGSAPLALMKNADIALYAAKSFGRGGHVQFVSAMAGPMKRRAAVMAIVREAMEHDRIGALYQPVIDLASGRLHGLEAVLHVFREHGRPLSEPEIRLVQDDVDLAEALGERLLHQMIKDVGHWRASGLDLARITVNAAAAEFRSGTYVERFLKHLATAGLPPTLFEVEVAETVFAGRGTDYVATALNTLSAAGVRISLDSFGTGPASLANLKRLHVDTIKIAPTFVEGFEHDDAASAIVRAIIGIASGFGIALGAEGIATPGQARLLRSLGCVTGQGGLFGDAAASEALVPLLHDRKASTAIDGDTNHPPADAGAAR